MTDDAPEGPPPLLHDVPSAISPYVRRIVANNPSEMTGPGTNTYLVGIDEVAVIDPGPDDDEHIDAIVGCGSGRIRWILLTHTHPDHWPGTAKLKAATGAEVCAFDDRDDVPVDRFLTDGEFIESTEYRLKVVHTPGHASNHLCYFLEEERMLFTGDHIMQGSTVVISPPDGDMALYFDSLERTRKLRTRSIAPGHGHVIEDPKGIIDEYLTHRRAREAQVLEAVQGGTTEIPAIVAALYPGLMEKLVVRAEASVWAHLRKLADDGLVVGDDRDGSWVPA